TGPMPPGSTGTTTKKTSSKAPTRSRRPVRLYPVEGVVVGLPDRSAHPLVAGIDVHRVHDVQHIGCCQLLGEPRIGRDDDQLAAGRPERPGIPTQHGHERSSDVGAPPSRMMTTESRVVGPIEGRAASNVVADAKNNVP